MINWHQGLGFCFVLQKYCFVSNFASYSPFSPIIDSLSYSSILLTAIMFLFSKKGNIPVPRGGNERRKVVDNPEQESTKNVRRVDNEKTHLKLFQSFVLEYG